MKRIKGFICILFCMILFTACVADKKESSVSNEPNKANVMATIEQTTTPIPTPIPIDENTLQVEIDLTKTYQTIKGFGASYNWYADLMLRDSIKEGIFDDLFKNAKMTILRLKNEYDYMTDDLTNCKEAKIYEMAQKRALEYQESMLVLMSCWSAPSYLKSNNSTDKGGTLKKNNKGEYMYRDYAQWWVDSVKKYEAAGVPIDYVSIQNECDYGNEWMQLNPKETEVAASYAKCYLATYNAFKNNLGETAPLMLGPETMSCEPTTLKSYMNDIISEAPESIAGITHHLYIGGKSTTNEDGTTNCNPDSFILNFLENSKLFSKYDIWQSEYFMGDTIETATVINNSMVYENAVSYIYWGGVWSKDFYDALVQTDGITYTLGHNYWAMRHFSEYIRPGYTRVEASLKGSPKIRLSAYTDSNKQKLVVVLINQDVKEYKALLPLKGDTVKDSEVFQSVFKEGKYDINNCYKNIGSLNQSQEVVLPGESITTVVIDLD